MMEPREASSPPRDPRVAASSPFGIAAAPTSVLLGALVEHTRSLLAVFDLDGCLRYLNPAALEMFEDARGDLDGVNDARSTWRTPTTSKRSRADSQRPLAAPRRRIPCELRVRRDDEWRTLQVALVNLLDDPVVRGVVVDGIDATEQLELAHRVLHDPLTGVANRVLLSDRLTHSMSRLERTRVR